MHNAEPAGVSGQWTLGNLTPVLHLQLQHPACTAVKYVNVTKISPAPCVAQ